MKELETLTAFLDSGAVPEPPETYVPGTPLAFFGFHGPDRPVYPGAGMLCADADSVRVYAAFRDCDIYNRAESDNVHTWETGDVLEFFFQPGGHLDYYEIHVTPELHTLQLHLPDSVTFRDMPFARQITDCRVEVRSTILREKQLWLAGIRLPFGAGCVLPECPETARFALCRYDYTRPAAAPVLSSTVRFARCYHEPEHWHTVNLKI